MIPQRTEILPRTKETCDSKPLRKGIFLHSDQVQINPLIGVKEVSKPLTQVTSDIRDPWTYMAHLTATRYAYETLLSSPFNRASIIGNHEGYGSFDFSILSGARRKNATRETTSPLKAWLHEHRKNPYPTKGEKIMLAILTKMTLTQISTWFANARRRLKKDNKMTWSPRNKSGEKSASKNEQPNKDGDAESAAAKEDEEMTDHPESFSETEKKDAACSEDFDLEDDVFSDANSSIELHDNIKFDNDSQSVEDKIEQTKTIWANISHASPKDLGKKLRYKGHNSPVGDLQRWVDGHFGNQSPVDFPRELTPPRTPVEEIVSTKTLSAKEMPREASPSMPNLHVADPPSQETGATEQLGTIDNEMVPAKRSSVLEKFSYTEEMIRSVASSENSLRSQFRSCGLTSHKEIDAVLALTTLSSR